MFVPLPTFFVDVRRIYQLHPKKIPPYSKSILAKQQITTNSINRTTKNSYRFWVYTSKTANFTTKDQKLYANYKNHFLDQKYIIFTKEEEEDLKATNEFSPKRSALSNTEVLKLRKKNPKNLDCFRLRIREIANQLNFFLQTRRTIHLPVTETLEMLA